MLASLILEMPGKPVIAQVTIDDPKPDEVLVKVAACGLCHSDIHIINGALLGAVNAPAVIGHEVAGYVEKVGSAVTEFAVGDKVVGCTSRHCGHCQQCLEGFTQLCANRRNVQRDSPRLTYQGQEVAQGGGLAGFAEYLLVGEDALVKVADEMPLDIAALLGCAVTAGAGAVIKAAKVNAGSIVAVFGAGGVGLSAIEAARMSGARQIIAIDIAEDKLELAKRFGATDVVNGRNGDTVAQIRALTGGGVDFSFECIGLQQTMLESVEILKPGHDAYFVGVPGQNVTIPLPGASLIMNGKGVKGVLMGSNNFKLDIPIMADLYLRGQFRLDELIGERIPLSKLADAIERMESGAVARTVVVFD
ncbi:zinc-binding dehydrogenase [Arthrobacter sp. AZCC_0090]|uniref:zinc-binding dehydrogenase n=1 Tax=Arthrobacter sp. AZCC_0090 TaxID=2735881 RepID=UPI001620CB1D|nr:zinc-binding dehydrogenase [Arthrobacter sp. AZCC_0090]MBB6407193.1 S-(hydroxymethyl)glutathione dehydrogenase/alcohol dehydrogenase [Arthrobacter sp. AZCC_0090]